MTREKSIRTFVKLILAAVSIGSPLALGTQAAAAQAIIVTAPFAFSAGSQSYPAGTYQFTLLTEWSLSIRNVRGGGEKFFSVRPEDNAPLGLHGGVIFRDSNSHQTLRAVYVPGTDRAAELLPHDALANK